MGSIDGIYGVIYRGMHNGKAAGGVNGCRLRARGANNDQSVLFHWKTGFTASVDVPAVSWPLRAGEDLATRFALAERQAHANKRPIQTLCICILSLRFDLRETAEARSTLRRPKPPRICVDRANRQNIPGAASLIPDTDSWHSRQE